MQCALVRCGWVILVSSARGVALRGEVRWQGRLACETCLALLSENNTTTVHGSISSGTLGATTSWGYWDGPAFETQGKMRLPKRGADPAPRLFFKRLSSVDHMAGPHAHQPRPFFLPSLEPSFQMWILP